MAAIRTMIRTATFAPSVAADGTITIATTDSSATTGPSAMIARNAQSVRIVTSDRTGPNLPSAPIARKVPNVPSAPNAVRAPTDALARAAIPKETIGLDVLPPAIGVSDGADSDREESPKPRRRVRKPQTDEGNEAEA